MSSIDRRRFLQRLAVSAPSLIGLVRRSEARGLVPPAVPAESPASAASVEPRRAPDYGQLLASSDSPQFEIPAGFRCVPLSSGGVASSVRPDLEVPNAFDGMAAFPLPNGNVRLIRNHEMVDSATSPHARPIGEPYYDPRATGGTTSLEVRISESAGDLKVDLVDEFVSLAGTCVNCAGGPTPWGSWLSCEETVRGPQDGYRRPHGYIFEVPVSAAGPVDPLPLRAMGRFVHEAAAVDPATGIVYETEDRDYEPDEEAGAGFYRFIPDQAGVLSAGGRLQMLAITGRPGAALALGQTVGAVLPVHWVDIDDPDPADAEENPLAVFRQGRAKGAASFDRLEGAWYGDGGIYIVSTSGGAARCGQVFHYRPTSDDAGELTVVFESLSSLMLDAPDNVVVSPRGGVVLCEDGTDDHYIRGLNREGQIFNLVHAPNPVGEYAGTCFSPDGRVLFFNVQGSSRAGGSRSSTTYAMWGPWEEGPV
ncbi:MAG: DUF839 domain-containing protein [Acidobacteriota bacterium]|nr:DUF839 domain-containing protein [Acidobacteriota bacterium]